MGGTAQGEQGKLPEAGKVSLSGSAANGTTLLEIGVGVKGIVAVGIEDYSAKEEPVLATLTAGEEGKSAIASWNGDRSVRAAVHLGIESLTDGQFQVRIPGELGGSRRLRLTLLSEDGRHFPLEISTDLTSGLNLSVMFGPGDCYDVRIECGGQGSCPACSETINCCNFPPRPCAVCPGCYVSCSCAGEPPPPNC